MALVSSSKLLWLAALTLSAALPTESMLHAQSNITILARSGDPVPPPSVGAFAGMSAPYAGPNSSFVFEASSNPNSYESAIWRATTVGIERLVGIGDSAPAGVPGGFYNETSAGSGRFTMIASDSDGTIVFYWSPDGGSLFRILRSPSGQSRVLPGNTAQLGLRNGRVLTSNYVAGGIDEILWRGSLIGPDEAIYTDGMHVPGFSFGFDLGYSISNDVGSAGWPVSDDGSVPALIFVEGTRPGYGGFTAGLYRFPPDGPPALVAAYPYPPECSLCPHPNPTPPDFNYQIGVCAINAGGSLAFVRVPYGFLESPRSRDIEVMRNGAAVFHFPTDAFQFAGGLDIQVGGSFTPYVQAFGDDGTIVVNCWLRHDQGFWPLIIAVNPDGSSSLIARFGDPLPGMPGSMMQPLNIGQFQPGSGRYVFLSANGGPNSVLLSWDRINGLRPVLSTGSTIGDGPAEYTVEYAGVNLLSYDSSGLPKSVAASGLMAAQASLVSPNQTHTQAIIQLDVNHQCPWFTRTPTSVWACDGETAELSAVATAVPNAPAITYRWEYGYIDFGPNGRYTAWSPVHDGFNEFIDNTHTRSFVAENSSTPTLRISQVQPVDFQLDIRCVVSNSCGTIKSAPVFVNMIASAPSIINQPVDAPFCTSASVAISVHCESTAAAVYQWTWTPVDGQPSIAVNEGPNVFQGITLFTASGADSPFLVIHREMTDPPRTLRGFRCVISNPCGTTTSDAATVSNCPADFNCDASLNSQDFFDFLSSFFSSDPRSDFNHDAQVNSQDFFDFITAFFTGCD